MKCIIGLGTGFDDGKEEWQIQNLVDRLRQLRTDMLFHVQHIVGMRVGTEHCLQVAVFKSARKM